MNIQQICEKLGANKADCNRAGSYNALFAKALKKSPETITIADINAFVSAAYDMHMEGLVLWFSAYGQSRYSLHVDATAQLENDSVVEFKDINAAIEWLKTTTTVNPYFLQDLHPTITIDAPADHLIAAKHRWTERYNGIMTDLGEPAQIVHVRMGPDNNITGQFRTVIVKSCSELGWINHQAKRGAARTRTQNYSGLCHWMSRAV